MVPEGEVETAPPCCGFIHRTDSMTGFALGGDEILSVHIQSSQNKQKVNKGTSLLETQPTVCRLNILSFPPGTLPLAPPTDLQQNDEFEKKSCANKSAGGLRWPRFQAPPRSG